MSSSLSRFTSLLPAFLQQNGRLSSKLLGGCRTLYSAEALGTNGYERQRERTIGQFAGMTDKFREKMKEFTTSDTKNMIFTEDLKNMIHLIENKPEELELVSLMMKRFNQQNKHLRFGNYIFGPVVMRMFHHLNQPKAALDAFKDPELEGFFDQLSSYQILCDLLFSNKMYQEVIDTFEIIKEKQVQGTKYPRNVLVLVFASCHKLNTVQSYEYALDLLQKMKQVGAEPVRRVVTYAAALALNQNAPNVALEILSLSGVSNYVTIRNLRLQALADLGRPDDCMPILRQSIEYDSPTGEKRASIFQDILEKIAKSVETLNNKDVTVEFERLQKALKEAGQIDSLPISSILESNIPAVTNLGQQNQQRFNNYNNNSYNNRQGGMQRSFRIGQSIDMRPRRNPTFEREQRSILSE